jgi:MtN3 and saliva related transmembrane protein
MVEPIGWLSSVILVTTIAVQIVKQWRERSARGVSRWLFVGQAAASLGFLIYSVLLRNWVFTLTNGMMLLSALIGAGMTWYFKHHGSGGARSNTASRALHADQ